MRFPRKPAVVVLAAAAVLPLAGCGSYEAAHDFNAPTPARIFPGHWTRIETPGNFPSLVFECHGSDGVYAAMDNASSAFVVRDDPNCTQAPSGTAATRTGGARR